MRPAVRHGLTAIAIAAGYLACILVSTTLRFSPEGSAIVWPVRAFLITLLLLLPPRQWWLLAAVVPVHFLASAGLRPDAPFLASTTQLAGHVGVALASVWALRRVMPTGPLFDSAASVFRFILVAGLVVPAVVNLATLSVHLATGWIDNLWLSWRHWLGTGFFVTITLPPMLVLAVQGGFTGRPRAPASLRIEIALTALAVFAVSFAAFGGLVDAESWPAAYLAPLPFLLWAASRFGVGGTALTLLAMAVGIVAQGILHTLPFADLPQIYEVVSLQIFLAATSAPMMMLAALMDERRRAANLLRQSEEHMQFAASATDTGLWQWDADPPHMWMSDNCRKIFGLAGETAVTPLAFLDAVHPDDQARVGEAIRATLTEGEAQPALEFRLASNGRPRWFILEMRAECDQVRKPALVSGVFRDVTERAEARLEVARLQDRLASLRDDERRRMAEQLHDSTAQHLVAAKLQLLTIRQRLPGEQQPLLDEVHRSLLEATSEIRTFTYLLHPTQLSEEGLGGVLRRYVPGFERRTGITTSVRLNELANDLPLDLQYALLNITQESLGNVQRHAQATRATVDVRCIAGNVHLIVRDNGRGICPKVGARLGERLRLGHGIPAMTTRVQKLGGRINIDEGRSGTTVHVLIPIDEASRPRAASPADTPTLRAVAQAG